MTQFGNSNCMLASAGDVVKIWDSSTFKKFSELESKNVSFQSVHWNTDCNQTISLPDRGEKVILSHWSNSDGKPKHAHLLIEGCCVAQFSSTSNRYFGVGTKTGSTMIYDLKAKTSYKTFGPAKSAVTCLKYNWNDSYIACGYADGSLMLHNSNTKRSSSPLTTEDAEKIHSLSYSYLNKSVIGCCSESGKVMLWDANTRQLRADFCGHDAPATGLQFSPTNRLLVASIGLDKKINFYDSDAKETVRTIDCNVPLCSLDFKEDGFTLAVGCTRGWIYFYDLRSPLAPHHSFQAHNSSVQSLSFQNTVITAASKQKVLKRNELPFKVESNESCDASKYIKSRESDLSSISMNINANKCDGVIGNWRKESLTADVFSPIRESASFANETNRNARNSTLFENSNFSFASTFLQQDQKAVEDSTPFSVGRKNIGEMKPASSVTRKKSSPSLHLPTKPVTTDVNDNVSARNKNGSSKQRLFKSPLSPQSMSALGICSRSGDCSSAAVWSCNPKDLQTSKEDSQEEMIVFQQPKLVENVTVPNDYSTSLPSNRGSHTLTPKTPESVALGHSGNKGNDFLVLETSDSNIDEGKGTSKSTTPMTPQSFQAEFFKQLIVDAMEEHTDNIRKLLYQFHVQMARDYERQNEYLEELFLRNAASSDHVTEIRKRREDCYLQNIFR